MIISAAMNARAILVAYWVEAQGRTLATPRNNMVPCRRCYAVGSVTDGGPNVLGNRLQMKKAQEARIKQEQRAGVIDRLLTEANEQGEKTEETPVKEVAPAK
jgi:hypothetical protein